MRLKVPAKLILKSFRMKSTTDVRTDKPSDGSQQGDHEYGSQVVIDAAVEKSYGMSHCK